MATRSMIGQMQDDQTVIGIYCHWDGYPDHNGRLLMEHWTDRAKVLEMLNHGDMSILGKNLGKQHHFDDREGRGEGCAFYGRDRREEVSVRRFSRKDWLDRETRFMGAEYIYTQSLDGEWFVSEGIGTEMVPVAQVIASEAEELD